MPYHGSLTKFPSSLSSIVIRSLGTSANKIKSVNSTDKIKLRSSHWMVTTTMMIVWLPDDDQLALLSLVDLTPSSRQHGAAELVDIETWFLRSDMLYKYECDHFDESDKTHPRYAQSNAFLFVRKNEIICV